MVKSYDDMLNRFHTILACHGRTDGRTETDRTAVSKSRVSVLTRDKKRTQVTTTQPAANVLGPKYVVILTYQRCGSSLFGNIFNLNPDAFYSYEPLDSLYSSLYGTAFGWNVPSDITNYANGTAR